MVKVTSKSLWFGVRPSKIRRWQSDQSCGGRGQSFPVGAQLADEADLRLEHPVTVGAGNGSRCLGLHVFILSFLPTSLCRCLFVTLMPASAAMNSSPLLGSLGGCQCSHEAGLIPNAFSDAFRVSLKRFVGAPSVRLPYWSSPNLSFFGNRWSVMRATWSTQLSCDFISMVGMLGSPARVSTSVSGLSPGDRMSNLKIDLLRQFTQIYGTPLPPPL